MIKSFKMAFLNYVDKILAFFDLLPTPYSYKVKYLYTVRHFQYHLVLST